MEKIYSIIGLAQRAGKASSGTMAAKNSLIRHRAKLLVISKDMSEKTKESLVNLSKKNRIPWIAYGSKNELGKSVGKAYRVAVTINDERMAAEITKIMRLNEEIKSTGVVEWQK